MNYLQKSDRSLKLQLLYEAEVLDPPLKSKVVHMSVGAEMCSDWAQLPRTGLTQFSCSSLRAAEIT